MHARDMKLAHFLRDYKIKNGTYREIKHGQEYPRKNLESNGRGRTCTIGYLDT